MGRHRPVVTVYTRQGCGLCVAAEQLVASEVRRRSPWSPRAAVEVVDVDRDAELVRRYGIRVPVVVVDGQEVAELEVTREQVRSGLRAAGRQGS